MRLPLVAIAILGLVMTYPALAVERLAMRVSPAVAFAPANLRVRAEVPADAVNRTLEIVAESEEFYRSSEIQLNGTRAPRVTTIEFRSLPGGTYEVRATLKDQDGTAIAYRHTSINVVDAPTSR